jgi:hypothetical protein
VSCTPLRSRQPSHRRVGFVDVGVAKAVNVDPWICGLSRAGRPLGPPDREQANAAVADGVGQLAGIDHPPGEVGIFEDVIATKDVHKGLGSLTIGSELRNNSQWLWSPIMTRTATTR